MATITTKFSIGDTVYSARLTTQGKQHPCPDCLGAHKWTAKSPAGREYEFSCPRCGGGYQHDRDLSLNYSVFVPSIDRLTIGQVRAEHGSCAEKTQYMCHETGIGSGTLHSEDDLFATESEAFEAATVKAKIANAETSWVVEQYNKSLMVSGYQLSDATVKVEEDRLSKIRITLNYLVDDLRGCSSIEEVQREIDKFDETKQAA